MGWWKFICRRDLGQKKVHLLEKFGASAEGLYGSGYLASVHSKKWPAVFCDCISVCLGRIEHLHRPSSRAMIFLVFCSMEAFKSMFSCLTSHQSFFSPVMTAVRLFDCSTLNWPNSTWTQALHSEQIKVSQQHASIEWSAVIATSATYTTDWSVGCIGDKWSTGYDGSTCVISSNRSVVTVIGEVGCRQQCKLPGLRTLETSSCSSITTDRGGIVVVIGDVG